MKLQVMFAMAVIGMTGLAAQVQAQTPSIIYTNVENYLLSNPSNQVWETSKVQLDVGADYQNALQWANDIRVGVNVVPEFQFNAEIVNAGIAGTVEAYEAGASYGYVDQSIKFELGADAGYDHQYQSGEVYPFVKIEKALPNNPNMYTFFEVGEPIYFRQREAAIPNRWTPSIRTGVGVDF